jgi:hypothetical protein
MKKLILFSLFAITTSVASSQLNKGQWLIGGEANFTSSNFESSNNESKTSIIRLSPKAGYFIIDKFAAGLRFGYDRTKVSNAFTYNTYSVAPFARYYFLPKEQKVNLFADASYSLNSSKQELGGSERMNSNGYLIQAGPAIFLNQSVALEFTLGYSRIKQNSNDYKTSAFQTGIGFQIHFGRGKVKEIENNGNR